MMREGDGERDYQKGQIIYRVSDIVIDSVRDRYIMKL